MTWWYNWNKNYDTKLFPDDKVKPSIKAEFVPMMWVASGVALIRAINRISSRTPIRLNRVGKLSWGTTSQVRGSS